MNENFKEEGSIHNSVENGILIITFSHPKSNALPGSLLVRLAEEIERAGENSYVKVIVLQSAGEKAFCAGASFDELLAIDNFERGKEFFMGFARVINAARKCPKFIIGRVQGKAVGGGIGLASATDYCMAAEAASIKLSELAIGIGPFVIGPAVERKIGVSAFNQLAINAAEWQTARWAKDKGLFMEVYSTVKDMDDAVNKLAEQLAKSSPEAMKYLKSVSWEGCEHWDELLFKRAEISGKLVLSEFTASAISNFKKKL